MIPLLQPEQKQQPLLPPPSSSRIPTLSSSSSLSLTSSRCLQRLRLHVPAMYHILLLLVVCLLVSADDAAEHDEVGYSLSATPTPTTTSSSASASSSSTSSSSTTSTTTTTTTTTTTLTPYLINIPSLGKIQGSRYSGIDFFGGIPYASPPVGNLRFAPPEEATSWKPHVLDATHFGPDCWQIVYTTISTTLYFT